MNLLDAKKYVSAWLWKSPARKTVNREWDEEYITDAAQMLMDNFCKTEQLEIANKSLTEELENRPQYERIQQQIQHAPVTWLPGLLGTVCMESIKRKVWKHDVSKAIAGMEATWRREKAAFPELQEGLERTRGK